LIAEIQQPSDVTYRLYDWGRVDAQGKPRELHLEAGLAATDFSKGPVYPVPPTSLSGFERSEKLIGTPHFVIHRHVGHGAIPIPQDDRLHVLMVLAGTMSVRSSSLFSVDRGGTLVLPAKRESLDFHLDEPAIVVDAFLPDEFQPT
jgi:mannose-6-phosphate isomerase